MAKKVISIRLSEDQLFKLDEVCDKLRLNRTEAISQAVNLLPKIIGNKDKQITLDDIYITEPWMDGDEN